MMFKGTDPPKTKVYRSEICPQSNDGSTKEIMYIYDIFVGQFAKVLNAFCGLRA